MPRARLGGVDLHYQRFGEGAEVVLLHGLTANLAFWHPAIVSGMAGERAVTLLDFRGHGRSGAPASGYTTRALAEDVLALLDHLGIASAHVIGHSWGGAVALHAAVLAPERVASLVLADARVRALQPAQGFDGWEQWPQIDARLRAHGIAIAPDLLAREFGLLEELARLRATGALDGVDLKPYVVPFAGGSVKAAERWLALLRDTTLAADLVDDAGLTRAAIAERAGQPALALYGQHSHCRATLDQLTAVLPRCRAAVVPGVGHFHPLLRPEAFLEHTRAFLSEIEAAAPVAAGRAD